MHGSWPLLTTIQHNRNTTQHTSLFHGGWVALVGEAGHVQCTSLRVELHVLPFSNMCFSSLLLLPHTTECNQTSNGKTALFIQHLLYISFFTITTCLMEFVCIFISGNQKGIMIHEGRWLANSNNSSKYSTSKKEKQV